MQTPSPTCPFIYQQCQRTADKFRRPIIIPDFCSGRRLSVYVGDRVVFSGQTGVTPSVTPHIWRVRWAVNEILYFF
jgi:hypothetical protein